MKKRNLSILVIMLLVSQLLLTTGFRHPNVVWPLFEEYAEALENEDNQAIIDIGEKIFSSYDDMEMCEEISSVICPKYKYSALAYLELGDYDNAELYLKKHIDMTKMRMQEYGVDETDNVIDGEALLRTITITPSVYAFSTNTNDIVDYDMIYEPDKGVYFGRVITGESKKWEPREGESAVIIYVEIFDENISDFYYMFDKQARENKVIELAWNFPNLFDDCDKILEESSDEYIRSNLEYIATVDSPILLRIGAEQNCWANPDPEIYKKAYVKIAKMAREICPDVALVFSLNSVGDRTYTYSDYYPGDDYVDWIGVSLYSNKYFKENDDEQTQISYSVGDYANPVVTMKPIVEEFGDRKPIMISEGGSGHYFKLKNEDTSDFSQKMLNYYYGSLPMVYPQIKCIMYFDTNIDSSKYDYLLSGNKNMLNLYSDLIENIPVYIDDYGDLTGSYIDVNTFSDKVEDSLKLGAYLAFPAYPKVEINFFIDDKLVDTTIDMPSICEISLKDIPLGTSDLKVQFDAANRYHRILNYSIFKGDNGVITIKDVVSSDKEVTANRSALKVLVDGKAVEFEAYIINGNTFYKLRDIAEVLKNTKKTFNIKWNSESKNIDLIPGENYDSVGGELGKAENISSCIGDPNKSELLLNGNSFKSTAYTIHSNNFFKLRDLGQLLDFSVEWNAVEKSIEILSTSGYNPE